MNANEPAFPTLPLSNANGQCIQDGNPGLTKREYFAAAALQALLPSEFGKQLHIECTKAFNGDPKKTVEYQVATALMYADALIAALNEEKKT